MDAPRHAWQSTVFGILGIKACSHLSEEPVHPPEVGARDADDRRDRLLGERQCGVKASRTEAVHVKNISACGLRWCW